MELREELLSFVEQISGGGGHFEFKRFDAGEGFGFEEGVALLHGAPVAGKVVDVEWIALGEVEIEKAAAESGRAVDKIGIGGGVEDRGEEADQVLQGAVAVIIESQLFGCAVE